jgi:hypothetical protein
MAHRLLLRFVTNCQRALPAARLLHEKALPDLVRQR